ncbi:hypothetical protein [Helcococcus kunzii]|uniref:hypothetical protein n=1 Tax=Helcococcus kunzii TaxID=40091 RepID=UPI0038A86048
MNRKDAIKVIEENRIQYRDWKQEEFDKAIEKLKEPLTLADFLGWIEDVEYEVEDLGVLKVKNNRLFRKSEECSSGWCNFALFTDKIEDLRQAKKVEPKLKAYHVKDEYDFEALKEELIKRGYKKDSAWGLKLDNVPLYLDWVGKLEYVLEIDKNLVKFYTKYDFEEVEDNYEVEEYKDERLFYAKIKGWELLRPEEVEGSDCGGKWFIYAPSVKEITTVSTYEGINDAWIASMTKSEWNKLGINDTNADFEEVE